MSEFLILFIASMAGSVTAACVERWYRAREIRRLLAVPPPPMERFGVAKFDLPFQASAKDDDTRGFPPLVGPQDELGGSFS